MNKPKYLYRISDGERLTQNPDGTYSFDLSEMNPKYVYSYELLVNTLTEFSPEPPKNINKNERTTTKKGILGVTFEHEGERKTFNQNFENNWIIDLACLSRLEHRTEFCDNQNDANTAKDLLKIIKKLMNL